jgi:2,4-dienoyl-CoA reductase-like NADH-dependent reductase (Old Yellow Enzyme family)
MTSSPLLEPWSIRGMTLRNRVMMSPMSQHKATTEGCVTPWHLVHYGSRAVGGVGLLMVEDCGVRADGRISTGGLGLYEDSQHAGLAQIVDFCHTAGAAIAVQLGHAGRKAFAKDGTDRPFHPVSASPIPFNDSSVVPRELTTGEVQDIVDAYANAARRAVSLGFDAVEVHASHGYLLHQFLSPLTNARTDQYGLEEDGGARLLGQVIARVRAELPDGTALIARLSADDVAPGGLGIEDGARLATVAVDSGADIIDISAGGVVDLVVGAHTGDQPQMAHYIKRQASCPTIAVGGVLTRDQGDHLIDDGACDVVAIGRALLNDPYWVLHAQQELDQSATSLSLGAAR